MNITLRDYFAAKALVGAVMLPDFNDCHPDDVADWCYQMADAMLAAREIDEVAT